MRIIVCGGRDYGHIVRTKPNLEDEPDSVLEAAAEYGFGINVLRRTLKSYGAITIIEGGATGADNIAANFAYAYSCHHLTFKADWRKHGKAAGPIRNQRMIDEGKPDLVIAFPGGKGTADMIARAKAANIPVIECDGKTMPTFNPITEN